jgi:small acid-soluble spore protein D (minor alpha/beta-type SASP)
LPPNKKFQILRVFPKRNNHILLVFGKAMVAERKDAFFGKCWIFPRKRKEKDIMKNNNQINVPQAREAMDRFKMQAASEVGVNLTNGYNGHLTSREAGSVGGQMVKKMIEAYEQGMQ